MKHILVLLTVLITSSCSSIPATMESIDVGKFEDLTPLLTPSPKLEKRHLMDIREKISVKLSFKVNENGKPIDVEVLNGYEAPSSYRKLAKKTFEQWTFELNDRNLNKFFTYTFVFKFEDL
jgi:hypothetical protein